MGPYKSYVTEDSEMFEFLETVRDDLKKRATMRFSLPTRISRSMKWTLRPKYQIRTG